MKVIFADTSGWLAIVVKSDSLHEKAVEIYLRLLKSNCRFIIHDAIMLEIGNSLSGSKFRNTVVKLKESIEKSNRIETVSLSPRTHRTRLETLR